MGGIGLGTLRDAVEDRGKGRRMISHPNGWAKRVRRGPSEVVFGLVISKQRVIEATLDRFKRYPFADVCRLD